MVRFIMLRMYRKKETPRTIYIPIWLDLLFFNEKIEPRQPPNLHSNMVRFIINCYKKIKKLEREFTFQYG